MSALLHTSFFFPFTPPTKPGIHETIGIQSFHGKGPHPFLRADSRDAHRKITAIGTPRYLNYCEIFRAHAQFRNVAAGRIIQPGGSGLTPMKSTGTDQHAAPVT